MVQNSSAMILNCNQDHYVLIIVINSTVKDENNARIRLNAMHVDYHL